MTHPDLERFVIAQNTGGTYVRALAELRNGRKESHWIWYVLPQLRGLGHSQRAHDYGIADLAEASAYLAHPVLGPRLRECAQVLLALPGSDPYAVMGGDDVKLRSCLTLFSLVSEEFAPVLAKYFDEADQSTLSRSLTPPRR